MVTSDDDLLHHHATYPSFHKDIFLQALRDGDERFCSPLLVNAVLAEGCVFPLHKPHGPL
jgi:hypothetical protein